MSALFVKPLPITVTSATADATNPASNLALNHPAMTWCKSAASTNTAVVADLGESFAGSYDVVALVGSNTTATEQWRVRTGTTSTGSGAYTSGYVAGYTGTLPEGSSVKLIHILPELRTERYVRFEFPFADGTKAIKGQRLIVGKRLAMSDMSGLDMNAEQSFIDQSVNFAGDGWSEFEQYPVLPQWKVTASFVNDTDWRADWFGFLRTVGRSSPFLFVPDITTPATWQTDAMFGRIVADVSANVQGYGIRKYEMTIRALSA